jgi:hypothetical protein
MSLHQRGLALVGGQLQRKGFSIEFGERKRCMDAACSVVAHI